LQLAFLTKVELKVRTYDIDFEGIVSNIVYIRWLEDLRMEMLAKHYPLERMLQQKKAPALISTHIEYKKALRLGDSVTGMIGLSQIRRSVWQAHIHFCGTKDPIAEAWQKGIFIDTEKQEMTSLPSGLEMAFKASIREIAKEEIKCAR
jgi:acyl-CoA thioester hydrolase